MIPGPAPVCIGLIAARYASRTETFVYREVEGLRREGFSVVVASLRPGTGGVPGVEPADLVLYGPGLGRSILGALVELLSHPRRAARTLLGALGDAIAPGEPTPARVRARLPFQAFFALALARALRRRSAGHVHCHFAHSPATAGMYAARQMGILFSFVGHANDLFRRPALLRRKLQRAAFVSCISEWHGRFYRDLEPTVGPRCRVIRCGVDTSSWAPRNGSSRRGEGPSLLTVARLVEKKGIDTLLRALGILVKEGETLWSLAVVGDGPLRERLEVLAREEGCAGVVRWLGPQDNERVRALMAEAEIFVLPCRTDAEGDRDGIPVVLMEAMASGLPVVAGRLPAIAELVQDGATGRLVDGDRPDQLAEVLRELARRPGERERLAAAARRRVMDEFSLQENAQRLRRALEEVGRT